MIEPSTKLHPFIGGESTARTHHLCPSLRQKVSHCTSKGSPSVLAQGLIIQVLRVFCLGKGHRVYDFHLSGGSSWRFYREIYLFCLTFTTSFRSIECAFAAFYLYGGGSVFLSSPQIQKKAFFNRVSNSYAVRTRIPVSEPRARTLDLPLLVMSGFFLVFFCLKPGAEATSVCT